MLERLIPVFMRDILLERVVCFDSHCDALIDLLQLKNRAAVVKNFDVDKNN